MRRIVGFFFLLLSTSLMAQPHVRPDALPPAPLKMPKSLDMASTVDQMLQWQSYPTYEAYLSLMEHYRDQYPSLCHIDTIGRSVEGRLILALVLDGGASAGKPSMLYSASIHGDEVVPYYLLLRLCDTLLNSYGRVPELTDLVDGVSITINPLANPDGTYHGGNHSVSGAWRYNANGVDLNRNYPDPFGSIALDTLQPENRQFIDYIAQRDFVLSATLHGGAEVLNYPWDSFTSREREVEQASWWKQVCARFIHRGRQHDASFMTEVSSTGYNAGGDWYVIHNGRQDYMNYYHDIRELTMEVSTTKLSASSLLDAKWGSMAPSLIGYIGEALSINSLSASDTGLSGPADDARVFPNPTRGTVYVSTPHATRVINLHHLPAGVYMVEVDGALRRVVKL